jgi:hypothetical protein
MTTAPDSDWLSAAVARARRAYAPEPPPPPAAPAPEPPPPARIPAGPRSSLPFSADWLRDAIRRAY